MKQQDFENGGNAAADISAPIGERSADDLRHDIQFQKDAIAGTIRQMDRRVQRATDWRAQVGDHPFIAVGAAFVAGGLLSAAFRHRPTPQERVMDALADGVEDITDNVRKRFVSHMTRGVSHGVLKVIGAALISKVASAYLAEQEIDETRFADHER